MTPESIKKSFFRPAGLEKYDMAIRKKQARKSRDKELRREAILDAAEDIFYKKGYEKTSMDHVAEQSGYAKGTLYLYYKNKEALYLALALRVKRRSEETICERAHEGENGYEKLRLLREAFFAYFRDRPRQYRTLQHSNQMTSRLLKKSSELREDRIFRTALEFFEEGREDGSISREIEPVPYLLAASAMEWGLLSFWHDRGEMLRKETGLDAAELVAYAHDLTDLKRIAGD